MQAQRGRIGLKRARAAFLAVLCAALVSGGMQASGYETLRISAPAEDETVHNNEGNVAVAVELSPPLRIAAGERIVLLLDGAVVASGSAQRFELTGIDRGTHSLRARVAAADGSAVAESATVTFHLWRASRLFPGRRN